MKLAAHAAFERGIDHLVLLHTVFAFEGAGDHIGGIMIAVSGQIIDGDRGIGQGFFDEAFNVWGSHGHGFISLKLASTLEG